MNNYDKLLEGEGKFGTYKDLLKMGRRGDNLTPHHVPSDAYMKAKISDYQTSQGIAIMMEHFSPGRGGRHRQTLSYGKSPNLALSPRTTLALDICNLRSIYRQQDLYDKLIKNSLNQLIELNKYTWKTFFEKGASTQ